MGVVDHLGRQVEHLGAQGIWLNCIRLVSLALTAFKAVGSTRGRAQRAAASACELDIDGYGFLQGTGSGPFLDLDAGAVMQISLVRVGADHGDCDRPMAIVRSPNLGETN
ncbi:MAG: hypothetical protein U1F35_15960 [Steroidobacteraceae bacterium]